jgi:hypothetical protein
MAFVQIFSSRRGLYSSGLGFEVSVYSYFFIYYLLILEKEFEAFHFDWGGLVACHAEGERGRMIYFRRLAVLCDYQNTVKIVGNPWFDGVYM